jgi:hypothetical protein
MGTSMETLRKWFDQGKSIGCAHMLVVCDAYNYEDYPIYVESGRDPLVVASERCSSGNMQQLMECYALHKPFDEQEMRGRFARDFSQPVPNDRVEETSEMAKEFSKPPKPLTPPDPDWCQAEKTGGHSFMTLGGTPKMERCGNATTVIVVEANAGADGQHGSMSLCDDCLGVFRKQMSNLSVHVFRREERR